MLRLLLRPVRDEDLETFFQQQCDAEACRLAAFPARSRRDFFAHWRDRVLADDGNLSRAIEVEGLVVGNVGSWQQDGVRMLGYWLGRDFWGRGLASRAVAEFVASVERHRPLYALVAKHNLGSVRVLEKCGFVVCASQGIEVHYVLEA